jgi:hypothetical protein
MLICGSSCLHRRGIPSARRLRAAQSGRHLAIVDALLVARLAAEQLFGGSRRLGLDLVRLPRLRATPSDICATSIIAISRTGARTIVEDNIGGSIQQQSGLCCRF